MQLFKIKETTLYQQNVQNCVICCLTGKCVENSKMHILQPHVRDFRETNKINPRNLNTSGSSTLKSAI